MPTLALLAYALFLLVAFGWRTWLHYRNTGDTGFRGFARDGVARAASIGFVLGLVLAPLAPVLELAGWVAPAAPLARPVLHAAGIAAFLGGFAVTVIAQLQMGASWRVGVDAAERTSLITRGLFGYVRNPIFTGMLLALVGLVLLVPNPVAAAALLCTWVGLELQVRRVEEPHLLRVHGARYRDYASAVGRFVPAVGRLRNGARECA